MGDMSGHMSPRCVPPEGRGDAGGSRIKRDGGRGGVKGDGGVRKRSCAVNDDDDDEDEDPVAVRGVK